MKFIKKHRKGLIVLAVIAVIIVGGYFGLKSLGNKTMAAISAAAVETDFAKNRDLVSVVAATGKIVSLDAKTVTSEAAGTKVLNVNVSLGDSVKAGDVIAILDSSDYEESLENAKETLETTEKNNKLSVSSAQRRLNEAVTSGTITDEKYAKEEETAKKNLEDTKQLRDQAESLYESAVEAQSVAQKNYDDAVKKLDTINSKITKLTSGDSYSKKKLESLNETLAETKKLITSYKASLDTAKSAANGQLANYNSYKSQVESYEKTLETIGENRADAKRNSDSSIASSQDSLSSTKLSIAGNTTSMEKQISSYEEQVEACTVTAPIDGVVTSLDVEAGDKYNGASIATIENIEGFEITAEIDEYDIGKIKTGQKVVIKTNGTGDEELKGTVKSIAPRATVGSSVTYKVVVSVDSKNEMLKLDMTAKLSIILQESQNTLTVPYDAVLTDDEANKYVEVVKSRDETGAVNTRKVYVTTGIETDYYTEITSGELKEGDEIKVQRESSTVFDFSSMLSGGGAMGGM